MCTNKAGKNGSPHRGKIAARLAAIGVSPPAADEPSTSSISELPTPQVLTQTEPLWWDEDEPTSKNYIALGRRLAEPDDLYRDPGYGAGLLLVSDCPGVPPKRISKGSQLAPAIADRLEVRVFRRGKPAGSMPSASHLNTMLQAEVFLQQFRPLDAVTSVPMYLPDFVLPRPGYNDGGPGSRIYYAGASPTIAADPVAITRFLDVMEFASEADRTNAVAAALTVMFRNLWPGAKPLDTVTSTKSQGGKETVIEFIAGRTPHLSLSYERQDWALQKNFAALVKSNPGVGLVNIENVRLDGKDDVLSSAFLERFLTDPQPVIASTGTGDPTPRRNDIVIATSTNVGRVSEDLLNRALPIHLEPVGDVAKRRSPIGNPKLEYLPAHREQIEAELRGMIERWKAEGQPLDLTVRHPFTDWARTIGGILMVSGYEHFLGNYDRHKTVDDPVRHAIGLLGSARPNICLPVAEWVLVASSLGVEKRLMSAADRDTPEGRKRGLGVVLSAHRDEKFEVETEDEVITLRLSKERKRFEGGTPSTRYRFVLVSRKAIPADDEKTNQL